MDYTTYLFSKAAQNTSSEPILLDAQQPSRTISAPDYLVAVKRISINLQSLGVADQDGIGLLSFNDIYYHVLGDAVIAAGAVFTGIPTTVTHDELATAIDVAGVRWLFVAPEFLSFALTTLQRIGLPSSNIFIFDPPGRDHPYQGPHHCLTNMLAASTAHEAAFRNANDGKDLDSRATHRIFTSGSTGGTLKAVVISHAASVARIDFHGTMIANRERYLYISGMYHVSAVTTHQQAVIGSHTMCITRLENSHTVTGYVALLGIHQALFPPRVIEDIVRNVGNDQETCRKQLASLDLVATGGLPCRQELVTDFLKLLPPSAKLRILYGATEMVPMTSRFVHDAWLTGQVGFVDGSTEIKIVDPETCKPLQPGDVGEICGRSPCCFSSYHNNDAATQAAFLPDEPGWFRTGDKGFLHPDTGELVLFGRFKQIFQVHRGEVCPPEVEAEMLGHADLTDVLITSTEARDNKTGRECMAYVVAKAGSSLTAQGLVDFVASRLAPHKAPTGAVVFCDAIPRGALGKPLANKLASLAPLAGSAKFLSVNAL